MPKCFDDLDASDIDTYNTSIKAGDNVRVVYYGRAGNEKMMKILQKDERKYFSECSSFHTQDDYNDLKLCFHYVLQKLTMIKSMACWS